MNNQILFERLRDLRERNHYTQAFVSSKLNIGRATYSNYERGKRTPSLDVIMDLAHFYNVPFTYFLNTENLEEIAVSKEPLILPLTSPEQKLMDTYRSLPQDRREQLLAFAVFLQNQP